VEALRSNPVHWKVREITMDAHESTRRDERSISLSISGMTCDGCARSVKRILLNVPGVTQANVDFRDGSALVEGTASPQAIAEAIADAGYGIKQL
jgi:copper chaperone CopZ